MGGGEEGAERPFKAIAILALSPVLGCWRARAASRRPQARRTGRRTRERTEPQSGRRHGTPNLSGRSSPGAPTFRACRSLWASPEDLTLRGPDPGEPATIPSSAAATTAGAGAAWSSWGSCSAS